MRRKQLHDERGDHAEQEDRDHGLAHNGFGLFRFACADIPPHGDTKAERDAGEYAAHEPCEGGGDGDGRGCVFAERTHHGCVHVLDDHDEKLFKDSRPGKLPDDACRVRAFVKHVNGAAQSHERASFLKSYKIIAAYSLRRKYLIT